MQCPHCEGNMVAGRTTYAVNRNGYHLIIDDVPILLCTHCQKQLFTEEAIHLVQNMVRTSNSQRHNKAIPGLGYRKRSE
jgi:YgiT-type zinc finger domain-containing protein